MKHDHRQFSADAAYRGNVEDIVRQFMPMVRRLAWKLHGSGRDAFDLDDLMQAGLVALTESAQRHQRDRAAGDQAAGGQMTGGDGFAAYAKMRVHGAMIDLIRRNTAGARGAGARRRQIEKAEQDLSLQLGRQPQPDETAAHLGIDVNELEDMRSRSQPLRFEPLDDAYSDGDARFADHGPDGLEMLLSAETRETLIRAIAALPDRLQMVIQLYFVEELGLAEIGQVLGVSVPRVHQLKARALEQLRSAMADLVEIR